jgi:Zn-dependent metalloprotease
MLARILLLSLITFSVGPTMAQQRLSVNANTLSSSSTRTGKLYYADRNEPPRAIEFKERTVTSSYFLANINQYFNIPTEFTFIEAESNTDNLGMQHRLLQQYYKGIAVEGLGYRVHEKNGFVTSANGRAIRNINLDTKTTFSEESAFHLAVKYLQTKDTVFRPGNKLIVSKDFTFVPESFSIAFQFDIDVSLIERWRISMDARTGQVINKVSLVNSCFKEKETTPPLPYGTGTGITNYYGTQTIRVETYENSTASRMVGQTENGGEIGTYDFANGHILSLVFGFFNIYDFSSSDNTYNLPYHKPAVSVQWAAEKAYEYYFKKHNRNSFDNNGAPIYSYVHVHNDMDNAFWTGRVMAFGDGSNNNPLVELDVVGHELTHGVTQHEANLQYYNESGALNESFSDIFGKAIEFDTFGDTATWQLAKHFRDGGLRDISNPNLKNQPDTYLGDMWFTGYEDNGGVHYNSGVQNFWFYLLSEGGSGVNDHQVRYSVNAIGMDATTKIAYRNLTEYLSYNSDYLDSRIGSLLATADLYGKNSVTYQEVDKAWDAVGVIDEPIITSLEIYDVYATTVKIKGSLLPRGDTVTYHFEYGTTSALGSSSPIYKYEDKVEGIISGLQSETKYYFRLVATNENGNTYYSTEFTTISLAPLVKIKQTVDVTETTAVLYGQINPNSLPTSFYFEYGLTQDFGLVTPSYPLPDTTEFLNISTSVINLQPRKTYYYRLVATNGFASSTTASVSFYTASKPIISAYTPVTAPIGTEVTITGQNFNSLPEKNLVSFGATRATVLTSSPTEIKVKVPAGASLGPITLLDAESGLAAESIREFVPTFTGEFKKNSLQLRVGISDTYIEQALVQDMDGDNKPDIVGLHYQGFSIFQNVNQGGDITDESFVRNNFTVGFSSYISLVDFDGNGLKDIVGRYQNGLRIYPNFSVPGYIFFGVPVDVPIGYIRNLTFGDFDQDGLVDIAGIGYIAGDSSMFTIIRNQNPKGYLSASNFEKRYEKILPYYVYFLTTGELNKDGAPDLMVGSYYRNFVAVLKNDSHRGAFDFEENIVQDSSRGRFVRYVSHDFNQDGWQDIASHSPFEIGNLAILENKGTSSGITLSVPAVALSENVQSAIQPGDINGDGNVDMMVGLDNRKFIFLENQVAAGLHLSDSSFKNFEAYGMPLGTTSSGIVYTNMAINDLNGDGRPEVINSYYYNFYPHDGYQMEIWQNSPANCLDPSLISLNVSYNNATIVLPPNTTLDKFEIEYSRLGDTYWNTANSLMFYLNAGYSYQLRARAKCYLGFTDYHYINFITDCEDTNNLSITNIGFNSVTLNAYNLSSLEVEYSLAGKNQWGILPQYANQIASLLHGTTYDLRLRGRCLAPVQFNYRQFTTLCPKLSTLTLTNVIYNKATVQWTSNYTGNAILEYSTDNVDWILINETRTMFPLIAGKKYFVRGKLACTNINSDFISTSFTTPCPKVSMLRADAVTPFSATINWADESDTKSYTLTYTISGAVKTVETNSTSFKLEGLTPGTKYTVTVAPQCIAARDFTSITFSTVCYVPFNLSANETTQTTTELSWSDNFIGRPYSIDYSISGSNAWQTKETTLTNISLSELRPGTEYEARVHITCLSETAPYVSVLFETNLYQETAFAPNPTDREITIFPSKNLIGNQFVIFDNAGRQVANAELLDYTINLSILPPGIYTLKIEGEKLMKVIKQ